MVKLRMKVTFAVRREEKRDTLQSVEVENVDSVEMSDIFLLR